MLKSLMRSFQRYLTLTEGPRRRILEIVMKDSMEATRQKREVEFKIRVLKGEKGEDRIFEESSRLKGSPPRERSRSRSVKFSPKAETIIEIKSPKITREYKANIATTRSPSDFESELKSLKEMINHKIPERRIKGRGS